MKDPYIYSRVDHPIVGNNVCKRRNVIEPKSSQSITWSINRPSVQVRALCILFPVYCSHSPYSQLKQSYRRREHNACFTERLRRTTQSTSSFATGTGSFTFFLVSLSLSLSLFPPPHQGQLIRETLSSSSGGGSLAHSRSSESKRSTTSRIECVRMSTAHLSLVTVSYSATLPR